MPLGVSWLGAFDAPREDPLALGVREEEDSWGPSARGAGGRAELVPSGGGRGGAAAGFAVGDRVCVKEGRSFQDFGSGDSGAVMRVDYEAGSCDVLFDRLVGGDSPPLTVACRHLDLEERGACRAGARSRARSSESLPGVVSRALAAPAADPAPADGHIPQHSSGSVAAALASAEGPRRPRSAMGRVQTWSLWDDVGEAANFRSSSSAGRLARMPASVASDGVRRREVARHGAVASAALSGEEDLDGSQLLAERYGGDRDRPARQPRASASGRWDDAPRADEVPAVRRGEGEGGDVASLSVRAPWGDIATLEGALDGFVCGLDLEPLGAAPTGGGRASDGGSRALEHAVRASAIATAKAAASAHAEAAGLRAAVDEVRALLSQEAEARSASLRRLEERTEQRIDSLRAEQLSTTEEWDRFLKEEQSRLRRRESQLTTWMGEALDGPFKALDKRLEVQEDHVRAQAQAADALQARITEFENGQDTPQDAVDSRRLASLTARLDSLQHRLEHHGGDSEKHSCLLDTLSEKVDALEAVAHQSTEGMRHAEALARQVQDLQASLAPQRNLAEILAARTESEDRRMASVTSRVEELQRAFDQERDTLECLASRTDTLQREMGTKAAIAQIEALAKCIDVAEDERGADRALLDAIVARVDALQEDLASKASRSETAMLQALANRMETAEAQADAMNQRLAGLRDEVGARATRSEFEDFAQTQASSMQELLSRWDQRVEARRRALLVEEGAASMASSPRRAVSPSASEAQGVPQAFSRTVESLAARFESLRAELVGKADVDRVEQQARAVEVVGHRIQQLQQQLQQAQHTQGQPRDAQLVQESLQRQQSQLTEALRVGRHAHDLAEEGKRSLESMSARVEGLHVALTAEVRVREEAVRRLEANTATFLGSEAPALSASLEGMRLGLGGRRRGLGTEEELQPGTPGSLGFAAAHAASVAANGDGSSLEGYIPLPRGGASATSRAPWSPAAEHQSFAAATTAAAQASLAPGGGGLAGGGQRAGMAEMGFASTSGSFSALPGAEGFIEGRISRLEELVAMRRPAGTAPSPCGAAETGTPVPLEPVAGGLCGGGGSAMSSPMGVMGFSPPSPLSGAWPSVV